MESKDKVDAFLNELSLTDPEKYEILVSLRKEVWRFTATIVERMMYGGILFSIDNEDFGGLFAYKKHVSFEFSQGFRFDDPDRLLEGSGKYRRHLKFYSIDDLVIKKPSNYIQQAIKLLEFKR